MAAAVIGNAPSVAALLSEGSIDVNFANDVRLQSIHFLSLTFCGGEIVAGFN